MITVVSEAFMIDLWLEVFSDFNGLITAAIPMVLVFFRLSDLNMG